MMSAMKKVFLALLFLGLTSCAARSSSLWVQHDKLLERLEKEKDKLRRQAEPVDRTKTQIKISEVLIALVGDAVKTGDYELMERRLEEYVEAIQDAHGTMVKTGRDAQKKPTGFKDLEISLRRQMRQLEDIGGALTFDQREPVEKARDEASEIREDLLKALFGGQNVSPRSS